MKKLEYKIKPVLKWAGGKTQLLNKIVPHIKSKLSIEGTYYEPFLGGGAVLFALQPSKAVANDFNAELINLYNTIKIKPDELIRELKKHKNTEDHFYKIRDLDRMPTFNDMSDVEKASRTIFLNKTCYNGLYRVNSKGEFNVPFANNKNPLIVDEKTIKGINKFLNANQISLMNTDFEETIKNIKQGDFVYFDPPYYPISNTASFLAYTKKSFNFFDQERLRNLAIRLHKQNVAFLISNSTAKEVMELYSDENIFEIKEVEVNRNINSKGDLRKGTKELLIFSK